MRVRARVAHNAGAGARRASMRVDRLCVAASMRLPSYQHSTRCRPRAGARVVRVSMPMRPRAAVSKRVRMYGRTTMQLSADRSLEAALEAVFKPGFAGWPFRRRSVGGSAHRYGISPKIEIWAILGCLVASAPAGSGSVFGVCRPQRTRRPDAYRRAYTQTRLPVSRAQSTSTRAVYVDAHAHALSTSTRARTRVSRRRRRMRGRCVTGGGRGVLLVRVPYARARSGRARTVPSSAQIGSQSQFQPRPSYSGFPARSRGLGTGPGHRWGKREEGGRGKKSNRGLSSLSPPPPSG
jgi:hypothetical protein